MCCLTCLSVLQSKWYSSAASPEEDRIPAVGLDARLGFHGVRMGLGFNRGRRGVWVVVKPVVIVRKPWYFLVNTVVGIITKSIPS